MKGCLVYTSGIFANAKNYYLSSVIIRKATIADREEIAEIYRAAASNVSGISRRPHEITDTFVYSLLNKKPSEIVFLVAVNEDDCVIGAVHGIKNGLDAYSHILNDLIVLVKPDAQAKGIGRQLAMAFLEHIFNHRPDVMRVEMEVINNLERAKAYEMAGFVVEGRTKNRIRQADGTFEDSLLMVWNNPNFKP